MRLKRFSTLILLLSITFLLNSQVYKPDPAIVEKIKNEGLNNSTIEELSFWMTDFAGPRLTASAGGDRGNDIAKKKMEEYGFRNVRIESVREFTRGGWDNHKTYAAMTKPYYVAFAANPSAWTGSTNGAIKSEVILVDIKTEEDFAKYAGKLKGKIVMLPSASTYTVNFRPLATRYTDEELERMANPPATPTQPTQQGDRRPTGPGAGVAGQVNLRGQITEFLKKEEVGVILNNSGTFNVPRSSGGSYKMGDPEPICQLAIPVEAFGRLQRLIAHNVPVEMEVEVLNKFNSTNQVFNVVGEIPGTDPVLKEEVVILGGHID